MKEKKGMKYGAAFFVAFASSILSLPRLVFAEQARFDNPLGGIQTIGEFVDHLLTVVVKIAIPFMVIMIIFSGFLFITARGNEEKLKTAKLTFLYVIVGAAIILGAKLFSSALVSTVNAL